MLLIKFWPNFKGRFLGSTTTWTIAATWTTTTMNKNNNMNNNKTRFLPNFKGWLNNNNTINKNNSNKTTTLTRSHLLMTWLLGSTTAWTTTTNITKQQYSMAQSGINNSNTNTNDNNNANYKKNNNNNKNTTTIKTFLSWKSVDFNVYKSFNSMFLVRCHVLLKCSPEAFCISLFCTDPLWCLNLTGSVFFVFPIYRDAVYCICKLAVYFWVIDLQKKNANHNRVFLTPKNFIFT